MSQPKVRSILKHNTVYTSTPQEHTPIVHDIPIRKKEKSATVMDREHTPRLTFDIEKPSQLNRIDLFDSPLSQPRSKEIPTISSGSLSPGKTSIKLKLSPVVPIVPKPTKALSHSPSLKGSFVKSNQREDSPSNPIPSPPSNLLFTKSSPPTIESRLNLNKVRSAGLKSDLTLGMNIPQTARVSSLNLKTLEDSPSDRGLQTDRLKLNAQSSGNLESPSQRNNVFRINIKQAPVEVVEQIKEADAAPRKKSTENEKKKKVMHFGINIPTKTVYVSPGKPREKIKSDALIPPRSSSQTSRKIDLRQRKDHQSIGAGVEKSAEKSIPLSREHSRPEAQGRISPTIFDIKKQMEDKYRVFGFEEFANISPKRKQSTDNMMRLKPVSPAKSSKNSSPFGFGFEAETEAEPKTSNLFIQTKRQSTINLKAVEEESAPAKQSNSFVTSDIGSPINKSNSKAVPEIQVLRIPGLEESLSDESETDQQEKYTRQAATDRKMDIFSTRNLFELNEENFFLNSKNFSSIGDIIKSARQASTNPEPPEDNAAPVIVSYLGGTLTIQPKFMETHGSMCFTELWSGRSKSTYKKIAKSTYGLLKKVNSAAEETLYRPEKALKMKNIVARLEANKNGDVSPSTRASELHRLGTISERPSIHRSIGSDTPKIKGFDSPKMKGFETPKMKGFESPKMRGVVDAPLRELPEARSMKSLFSKQLSLIVP